MQYNDFAYSMPKESNADTFDKNIIFNY